MPIEVSCPCGNGELTEIPSGADSRAYECSACGGTVFIQFVKPQEEDQKK